MDLTFWFCSFNESWMFLLFGLLGIIFKYIVDYIFTVHIRTKWFFDWYINIKSVWFNWIGIANTYYYVLIFPLIHFNSFENKCKFTDCEFREYDFRLRFPKIEKYKRKTRIKIYQSTKLPSKNALIPNKAEWMQWLFMNDEW